MAVSPTPRLQRQKHQGRFVYLAADPRQAKAQMAQRAQPKASPVLSAAAEAVVILVAAIKHPRWSPERLGASLRASDPQLTPGGGGAGTLRPPRLDAKKNAPLDGLNCLGDYRRQLCDQTTRAALFPQPPVLDFTAPPALPKRRASFLRGRKTHTRRILTLSIGEWLARETIWWHPKSGRQYPSAPLRRWVVNDNYFSPLACHLSPRGWGARRIRCPGTCRWWPIFTDRIASW